MIIGTFPGCQRYICWVEDVFYQGEKVTTYEAVAQQYIRSEHVYDQFSPLAHFDVLWLSNEVRTAYALSHRQKHCLSVDRYQAFLRRQLEENKHYISFYLLAAVSKPCGSGILTDKDSDWTVCLQIGQCLYRPIEIKLLDSLAPEYITFFGKNYTRFKTLYQVRFDARDIQGHYLIHGGVDQFTMWFNRVDRKVSMTWCIDGSGNVIRQNSNDPSVLAYDLQCDCI
jgi:hypothetical protein